jgi:yecA family protein
MTRYEALIGKNWEKIGMANLFVSRTREGGDSDYAVFVIDLYCLGVKDCFSETGVSESMLREFIETRLPPDSQERIHPACAKKLIEGAVAYAESLGFAPARDFRKARKVLSSVDCSICPRDFTFGCDGRPRYIRGPDDSEERVDRVLTILTARFGEEGFDYEDPQQDDEPDALAVREDLIAWLAAEPDDVPRFYEVSGIFTAMLICPTVLSPSEIYAVLWGPEGKVWETADDAQEFSSLLMAYWNQLNDLVYDAITPGAHPDEQILDVWEQDFPDQEGNGIAMAAAMFEWARGFRRATELWPDAWGDALTRPDLAPHWEVVGWWANFDRQENRDKMVAAAESAPPRTMNTSVKALACALRPPSGQPPRFT